MSFRAAREAKSRRRPPLDLSFERRDWRFEGGSGDPVEGRGYVLRDGERSLSWTSRALSEAGMEVVKVAGASYRPADLQDPGFAPGSPLVLRPEPENPHDSNAIGVWNETGTAQAGYLPREQAAALAARLRAERLETVALWEWRGADGRRSGLRILIAPTGTAGSLAGSQARPD
jgi:hypothetical protein